MCYFALTEKKKYDFYIRIRFRQQVAECLQIQLDVNSKFNLKSKDLDLETIDGYSYSVILT